MRSATRVLLAALALAWAGSAAAQNDVTFQVDLSNYIASCQFNPATETAFVRGSFQVTPEAPNGFTLANPLTAAGNGIYSATVSIPTGPITYKFYSGLTANPSTEGTIGWEGGSDRTYTVTAGAQTIPAATFNGPAVTNACSSTNQDYDLIFEVDMSIQQGRGLFNPGAGDIVGINGQLPNGWDNNNPTPLTEDSFRPGVYSGILPRTAAAPSATGFKFVVKKLDGTIAWESALSNTPDQTGGNRTIRLTGTEPVLGGRRQFTYDNDNNPATPVFFDDAGAESFLSGNATVTFNVDMRPAFYRLRDTGALPQGDGSPAGGNTAITSVSINGPAAGESLEDGGPAGGIGDWAAWGAVLNAQDGRRLSDANADSVWTVTLTYGPGARRNMVAKFGVNGADDESGFGGDHRFTITEGAQTISFNFGCIRNADGTFTSSTASGAFTAYQNYLRINNTATPPTCTVVRRGAVSSEGGPQIAGLEISDAYPNPARGTSRIALGLDTATDVSVRVFDVTGRQVAVAAEGFRAAGESTVDIDTRGFSAGLYVVRVEANGAVVSRRLTVAR